MYLKHLSSLQFLTLRRVLRRRRSRRSSGSCPGRKPPIARRAVLGRGARTRTIASSAKYFVAGGVFLVLGSVHMVAEEPAVGRRVARARRLRGPPRPRPLEHPRDDRRRRNADRHRASAGTCCPAIVGRPLASEGLAQGAFWFTAVGLSVFYVALVGNGIAIGRADRSTARTTRRPRRTWATGTRRRSAWAPA